MAILGKFLKHRDGNFAVMAALGAVPLIFATGAGLDVSRMYSARVQLQQAIDSAALSVVKESGFDKAAADAIAERMLLANFGPNYRALSVELSESGARVSAEVVTPTTLTAVFGYKEMTAQVTGTVEYPQTRYEIGLVLDTTGSMAGTKLAEMKKAAAAMVDELSATPLLRQRVRFALVPFSTYVNVGGDNKNAAWIDTEGLVHLPGSIIPTGVSRTRIFQAGFPGEGWKGCVEARIESGTETFSVDDTAPSKSNPRTLFVPMLSPDEPADTNGRGRPLYPNNFTKDDTLKGLGVTISSAGVVSYLQAVLNVGSYLFYGNSSDPQGPNNGCSARPLTPLTDDFAAIKSEITQLKAEGSTNITEGMAWGARVLSPGEPFTEGLDPDQDVEKIIVLLTDGDNTMTQLPNAKGSAYSAYGYLSDWRWDKSYKNGGYGKLCNNGDVPDGDGNCSKKKGADVTAVTQAQILTAMNADTLAACDSAKESGQEVYTIRLEVNTTTSSTLLSNCASDAAHYFDAKSAADLPAIFDAITQRILKLRITS
ncbi:pilus assembly protein [Aureimonas glaciei]|jgi:Flp pilus assembly protein TadG|uniref:VWFA domain-containing protein n=1 Tax=Aureimonas glaciei TaxID=1776957 RepID=A0A916XRI2_9HYPH|nr:pilus assembly protein [Aureimonas glaciei]GGD02798.1 hypothetical protein GCM10011335_01860 [Aureimonas glaciei]